MPLSGYTTFRIGGPARYLAEVSSPEDVVEAAVTARNMGLSWTTIGHGSNILASDDPIDRAVIVYRSKTAPKILDDGRVEVSGGYPLHKLIEFLVLKGLGGLEKLVGIPGTVGGAIAGNAGAYGTWISEHVELLSVLNGDADEITRSQEDCSFEYRDSVIKRKGEIILKATLNMRPEDSEVLRNELAAKIADRRQKHPDPERIPTAGSFFKNPKSPDGKRKAAGEMLEKVGCKKLRVGNAKTWHKHANIIVTDGPSTAIDIRQLALQMTERVLDEFGINLMPEVTYLY